MLPSKFLNIYINWGLVVFSFYTINACVQTEFVEGEDHDHSITSRINLVDLAGSERCNSAQTSGDRLRVHTHTHILVIAD